MWAFGKPERAKTGSRSDVWFCAPGGLVTLARRGSPGAGSGSSRARLPSLLGVAQGARLVADAVGAVEV